MSHYELCQQVEQLNMGVSGKRGLGKCCSTADQSNISLSVMSIGVQLVKSLHMVTAKS